MVVEIFEYVIVLISIIIGLALTHLMQGIATLVQHPRRERVWWVHLVWVGYMFLTTVFWWWWQFRLRSVETWTFGIYLLVIAYAFLVYLVCAMLFPKDLEGYAGYREYFLSRRQWFFSLLLAWLGIDILDSWIKGAAHLASLGSEYFIASGVSAVLILLGFLTRREMIHAALAVTLLGYQVSWAFRLFNTVS